jgi:NAD(P)-dependent dehydrogenase (short-subunit alcohol dehydrogenase family)
LPKRTIVITGASDGVGRAAARRLAAAGDNVVVVGRSESKTRAIADELGADYVCTDFSDLAQVRALAVSCGSGIRESTCWPTTLEASSPPMA